MPAKVPALISLSLLLRGGMRSEVVEVVLRCLLWVGVLERIFLNQKSGSYLFVPTETAAATSLRILGLMMS